MNVNNLHVGVLGFGRSGSACTELLLTLGAKVFVSEHKEMELPQGINGETGGHTEKILENDLIIVSPGIKPDLEILKKAYELGIPVITEFEFAWHFIKSKTKVIAVTGTNGKTTTCYMIKSIFDKTHFNSIVAGNMGTPLSSVVSKIKKDTIVILELSSFQLHYVKDFRPDISIILNIKEDHFDWHKDLEDYKNSKKRIFMNQKEEDFAVLNKLDKNIIEITQNIKPEKKFFANTYDETAHAYIKENYIVLGKEKILNTQNLFYAWIDDALAAILATKLMNVEIPSIVNGILEFKGVPHRLELVKVFRNRKFINNSMCTNPHAFVNSLRSVAEKDGKPILIAGGKSKNTDISPIIHAITKFAKHVILIGEVRNELYNALTEKNYTFITKLDCMEKRAVDEATRIAYTLTKDGDTILFSPGFASFDMFRDFAERGEYFKKCVKSLCN